MSQTAKFFIVGALCFLIGGGAFYAWSTMNELKEQNETLNNQLSVSPTPTSSPDANSQLTQSPSPTTKAEQGGKISGAIGYPSEGIPPLVVYAFEEDNLSKYHSITTDQNQTSFVIDAVVPGTYVVVAYPVDSPGLSGGYTKAVPCGLRVDCTDHSLIPVMVVAEKTTQNVDIKDWYAPEGTFPAKPN